MEYIFCALIFVGIILLAFLLYLIISYLRDEKGENTKTSAGFDIKNNHAGFSSLQNGTSIAVNSFVRAVVFLEDCQSRNQYRAEIRNESVVGRLIMGSPGINDVAISTSPHVSRRHCRFFERNGRVFLENLSTVNGTSLNGSRIYEPERISVGDFITLSDIELRVIAIQVV